ncbi:MAG: lactate racemase domain-containing protein [Phycisphaerae bacterium]|jgi:nickel-dependent lactate racemase
MPELSLPWGKQELKVTLPEHWKLQQVARSSLPAAGEDWPQRMAAALGQPTGELSLAQLLAARRNGRIVLVVEDMTRHSPLPAILDVVMREVEHARVPSDQVEIVIAAGMHLPLTAEQAATKLGPYASSLRWRCNPWQDPSQYVHVGDVDAMPVLIDRGVAEADLRIIISSVSPHMQAGFGGGYKMFTPGCASIQTIRALHQLGLGDKAEQRVGTDSAHNAMRQAIDRAGVLVDAHKGKSFAIQYVLDEADLPSLMAAGDVQSAQQMLAKRCNVACGVVVETPADVVVVDAHPRDYDLWQSFKCIANTIWAARPNGVIICLTRCEAGAEGMKLPRWTLSGTWARRLVRLFGGTRLAALVNRLAPSLASDASFFIRIALQTIHRNTVLMVSPTLAAMEKPFPGLSVYATFEEAVQAATRILGRSPQRVIAFPSGGTTFPILAATPARSTQE